MKTYKTLKTIAFAFVIVSLIAGCSKSSSSTNNINNPDATWSFKGITYKEVYSGGSYSTISFADTFAVHANSLTIQFPGQTLPVTSGTYIISNVNSPAGGKVFIQFNMANGSYYAPTGGNGNQTVNVTVTNGKLTISGTNIELVGNAPDSAALTLNVHEI